MLIDGKNSLYRALFAGAADKKFQASGQHPFIIFTHFAHYYYDLYRPNEIHVFWDDKQKDLWRKKTYPAYKDGRVDRSEKHGFNVEDAMQNIEDVAKAIIPEMGMRMYSKDMMEADDLIYAFVQTLAPDDKAIIVSSDGDFIQLESGNVKIFNPMGKSKRYKYPVLMKCLMGDKSDNIPGYRGIGPKKAEKLCEDSDALFKFIKAQPQTLITNRQLIDMSKCPWAEQNIEYVKLAHRRKVHFDQAALEEIAIRMKVRGLVAGMHRYILPFKNLVPK